MGQIEGEIRHLKDEEIQAVQRNPLAWQKQGLQYTASGYGKKIPTERMVTVGGREYRVYAQVYGNAASHYIIIGGKQVNLWDWQLDEKPLKTPEEERRYVEHLRVADPGHFGKATVPEHGHLTGQLGRLYKAHVRREKRKINRRPRLSR